ncbi:MAG TPA: polysaccharide biosynthesis/export family protein [Verrucomicrobiae bacterium]|nr:polysaccharide biosynthesis/export family protein [Verrucomicrobiae bacterium]
MNHKISFVGVLIAGLAVSAALAQVQPVTNAFSISAPTDLADWQKRLTLGPGDVLNLSLYEQPETARNGVTIGPDGRINYLQARDILATGLTVDELREKLESALLKYYRPPLRVVAQPSAYNSKKFYVLGNVTTKGVFALDRPTTVLEAIARAKGFANPAQRRSTLVMADLSRSFLIRRDVAGTFHRVPVDFENLFLHGDLTQNIALAPDDYLYFPPTDIQDVYVFGEVLSPGPVPHTGEMTAMRALAGRGGFTPRAYKSHVLIVRGSLSQPQTIIVNTTDILSAKARDVKLQPRDIVYVSRKPWYKAEELLELAITSFLRSAVVYSVGEYMGPYIDPPLLRGGNSDRGRNSGTSTTP